MTKNVRKSLVRKPKRYKTTLQEKLFVVLRYIEFATARLNQPDKVLGLFEHPNKLLKRSEKSIDSFLKVENCRWSVGNKLVLSNVFKWILAYKRGDLFGWNGINDLTKCNARSKQILNHINDNLVSKFPIVCHYHRVVRSPSSPDRYGVVARISITSGTFLGFFSGSLKTSETDGFPGGANQFTTIEADNRIFVDCNDDFFACYARYYNRSTKPENHNVCVVRIPEGCVPNGNHNHMICFVANNNILAGDELIMGFDQGYLRNGGIKRYKTVECVLDVDTVVNSAVQYVLSGGA